MESWLHPPRCQSLEDEFAVVYHPAAVPTDIDNQATLRERRYETDELVNDLVARPRTSESEDNQMSQLEW